MVELRLGKISRLLAQNLVDRPSELSRNIAGCIKLALAVVPYDIFWLGEPLHWYLQPADFRRLAAASPIPLAHGEREWHRYTVRYFIDSSAIRYVQFNSTRHAGFTES